jgi:tRNA nucleotidyltransferase/poly(A) polymerase
MMLQALREILRRRGSEGWLVGGTVRDHQSGRFSPDLDVVVADDPAAVARDLAARLRSPWFPLSTRHGAYRVIGPDGHVDVAQIRGAGIVEDLSHRDFTVNAMAVSLLAGPDPALEIGAESGRRSEEEVLDPFGGRAHLAAGLLVAVSDRIFSDDPLRLMRAVRFSHVLGLRMDAALEEMVRSQSGELTRTASERIVTELALTLEPGCSGSAVRRLDELGLLPVFLPEASASEPAGWLDALDGLVLTSAWEDMPWAPLLEQRMGTPVDGTFSRAAGLRLATLLCSAPPRGVAHAGRRLKLSGAAVSLLHSVSSWFRRADDQGLTPGRGLESAAASARSSTLFCWETSPWEPEVVLIAAARTIAAQGRRDALADIPPAERLIDTWASREAGLPDPPFDGRSLMAALGLSEGPELGRILRETRLAWEAGEVRDLAEAVEVARIIRGSASGRL